MLIFVLMEAFCVPYPSGIGTHTFLNMDHLRLGSHSKVMSLSGHKKTSLFYVSTASLDLQGISGAIRILGILLFPLKKLISSSEQLVKSNMKVNYSIILLFKAKEYIDNSISNHMLCLQYDLFILL